MQKKKQQKKQTECKTKIQKLLATFEDVLLIST